MTKIWRGAIVLLFFTAANIGYLSASYVPECVENAVCTTGECQCSPNPPFVWGKGNFSCYKKRQVAAEVKSDPQLTNFNNETVKFPWPCRYLITHAVTELKEHNKTVIGECEFQIFGFNAKASGKIFAHGIDIAIRLKYDNGTVKEMSARKFGNASNGVYSYTFKGTDNAYQPDGPWGSDTIHYEDTANGIIVRCFENISYKTAKFEADKCGLQSTLTAYDTELKIHQSRIPGISVAVDCAHHPEWLSNDIVLGLAPSWQGGQTFADIKITGLTKAESVLVRAVKSAYSQVQPLYDEYECTVNPFSYCDHEGLIRARDRCFWMLRRPTFIRCIDGPGVSGGDNILFLFNRCVIGECINSEAFCQQLKDYAGTCNQYDLPDFANYMNTTCER